MEVYIRGMGNISPQATVSNELFLKEPVEYHENYLTVIDPGYKNYIDPKLTRRMSKVIKMGVAAAKICMDDAGITMPESITVGTGLGCIEDTEFFLSEILKNEEQLLTPTSFIQSTHNTVAAQVALMIRCHAPNFTYVNRGISFELAVHDAMMQLHEGSARQVLTGAVDELTPNSFSILKRMGLIKREPIGNLSLFHHQSKGFIAGEGACFFILSSDRDEQNYARLSIMKMIFNPTSENEVGNFIVNSLKETGLDVSDIDLVVGGMNGDAHGDEMYRTLQTGIFKHASWAGFKHLCGEYHTASAFALWMAAKILRDQRIPRIAMLSEADNVPVKNIMIYNHYKNRNHAVYILQSC